MVLDYDIIIIGGGHAGCEAAAAAARLGSRTLLLTMDMSKLASMSCNPAVGGVAKGQIVREIDALGGQMGRITDLTAIQFRMLNRSKGAAMWSPRAQCDKTRFSEEWRHTLENTTNLYIWQDAATELLFENIEESGVGNSNCIANSDFQKISSDKIDKMVLTGAASASASSTGSSSASSTGSSSTLSTASSTAPSIAPSTISTSAPSTASSTPAIVPSAAIASAGIATPNSPATDASLIAQPSSDCGPSTPVFPDGNTGVDQIAPDQHASDQFSSNRVSSNRVSSDQLSSDYSSSDPIATDSISSGPIFFSATPSDPTSHSTTRSTFSRRIRGVRTRMGVEFSCRAVVLTSGTFLDGVMHCGASQAEGGRAGDAASHGITECLKNIGFETGRMKTGTPARLDARTINFELLEPQYGDENPAKFSFSSETQPVKEQLPCFLVYTSTEVHDTLRDGFSLSPLFNGTIKGIGPRYCPSIEDKLRTFAEKEQHQLFLEPEGRSTNEYYLNGFSSSLPWDVQWEALRKIRGFEDLHIFRPGYAIEYDYFPPTQLHHSLETKLVSGLFFAGQINGTTGYEEAAAQGLMAGINAHHKLNAKEAIVLQRDEAYIGVLIDDLVTKGVDEPYRMFTSRAEYRILLRQDNADMRLTPIGDQIGLISPSRNAQFQQKKAFVESLISFARKLSIRAEEINSYLKSINSEPLTQGRKLFDILTRNNVTIESLQEILPKLKSFILSNKITTEVIEEAEIQIKYKGYIERERAIADKLQRLEDIHIPADFDFHAMNSLTIEARQKLSRIRPATIGQAARVPGVSPADVNVLLVKFGR